MEIFLPRTPEEHIIETNKEFLIHLMQEQEVRMVEMVKVQK